MKKKDDQAWKENEIVYIDKQIYIPNSRKIREHVLWENHDLMDVGHPEQKECWN